MNERPVYSVTQLTEEIAGLLSDRFGTISVEGEISGWKVAASSHAYFTLKDEKSLLKAVMWRSRLERLKSAPMDGQLVRATGSITVYPPRGEYQLDVTTLAQAGAGLLQQRFEELKKRLQAEGLFDLERKRVTALPIRRVVVITSPAAAALRDFLRTLEHYKTALEVLIIPVRVQGIEAPPEIVFALEQAPRFKPDLVVLTRGGGSLEDLWAFNEEAVARAIAASPIPVLSAVGHEVDFTIADFVADLRASTPTAAAGMLAGWERETRERVAEIRDRLHSAFEDFLDALREELEAIQNRLHARSPLVFVPFHRQRIDDFLGRGEQAIRGALRAERAEVSGLARRLASEARLDRVRWRGEVDSLRRRLAVLDPRATLRRGFALIESAMEARPIRVLAEVPVKGDIRVQLADGDFLATPKG